MKSRQAVKVKAKKKKGGEPVFGHLDPAVIIPCPENPRQNFNFKSDSWLEFVASIKSGVRVPIQVNKVGKKYKLMAGARRTFAAIDAELKTIPSLVYDNLSDEEAFEITFHENFGREDLSPLEEGRAVEILLEMYSGDADAVASKMGRSVSWVKMRAKLKDLCPVIREAIANPNEAMSRWSAGHLALISGFPDNAQVEIYECFEYEKNPTLKEIEKRLSSFMRLLSHAIWPLSEKVDSIESCDKCQSRTGCHPGLFDDFEDVKKVAGDRCLIEECWISKTRASVLLKLEEMKKKHKKVELICLSENRWASGHAAIMESYGNKVLLKGTYKVLKRPGKNTVVPALWVGGPSIGTECLIVLIEDKYDRERREERDAIRAEKKTPEYKARVATEKLNAKRDKWMSQVLVNNLHDSPGDVYLDIEVPPMEKLIELLMIVALRRGCWSDGLDCQYEDEDLTNDWVENAWNLIKKTLGEMLEKGVSENVRFLDQMGVDVEALKTKAIEAVPE